MLSLIISFNLIEFLGLIFKYFMNIIYLIAKIVYTTMQFVYALYSIKK